MWLELEGGCGWGYESGVVGARGWVRLGLKVGRGWGYKSVVVGARGWVMFGATSRAWLGYRLRIVNPVSRLCLGLDCVWVGRWVGCGRGLTSAVVRLLDYYNC